jgi:hypothetical protein
MPPGQVAHVPTATMLAGDFTAFASPACDAGRPVSLGAGFSGNRIDPSRFSPAALNLAKRLPTTTDPCGETLFSLPDDRDEGQYVGRIDYQLNGNQSIFGRYMATRDKKPSAFAKTSNVLTTIDPHIDNLAQSFTIGDTNVFGTNGVNNVRFAFNRTAVNRDNDPYFDPHDLGINVNSYVPHQMIVVVTGGFHIAAATATRGIAENNSFQVNDDLALVHGKHQFGFGVNVARFTVVRPQGSDLRISFSGAWRRSINRVSRVWRSTSGTTARTRKIPGRSRTVSRSTEACGGSRFSART